MQNNNSIIDNLKLGDEYIFETVLYQNKELTKQLIEKITGICDIGRIEYISTEETQKATFGGKGVRFDVYIKGQDGVAYIVELQQRDTYEIPKRLRYYQVTSDARQLPKGKDSKYNNLKDNFVIFICREDIFGYGLYKYTFENMCHEVQGLTLDDGTYKIFLNTQGTNGDVCAEVVDFLHAINGEIAKTEFVKEFERATEEIKEDEIWRAEYMQSLLREQEKFECAWNDGMQQGIQQGVEQRNLEIAKKMILRGDDIADITELSGLSKEEILELK